MAHSTKFAGLLLVIMLVALLTGCGGDGSTPALNQNRRFRSLEFALTTPKTTYAHGEQVPMTFTVKNIGSQKVSMVGGDCEVFFKIRQGSLSFDPDIGCGASGYIIDLDPGQTKTYNLEWDQMDGHGSLVQAGQDTITVWLTAGNIDGTLLSKAETEQNLAANPIQIIVTP